MMPQPTQSGEVRRETHLSPPQPAGERWRHAFRLVGAYWTSKDWKFAWFAVILLLGFQFGTTYLFVATNRWQQAFYDGIEKREVGRFAWLMMLFFGIMALQVSISLVETFIRMVLGIRWRRYLTDRYIGRYLSHNRYAEIERLRMIDNPDQRIADDIGALTGTKGNMPSVVTIALGFVGSIVGSITFAMILMETAEPIRFSLFGTAVSIPGGTVWYAVLYAMFGSFVIGWIGRPFIRATMRLQHVEADFRGNLMHVRRNAAQIGFAGAVATEQAALVESFDQIRRNFRRLILTTLGIQAGDGVYQRVGGIIPIMLLVPRYFAGAISFGQVMGARDAFGTMVQNLSIFVQQFSWIGQQVANINRLKALDDAIDARRPRGIAFTFRPDAGPSTAIATQGLRIARPSGAAMLDIGDWTVRRGERWVVQGPSGAGKSTLLRAIAGLWPDGAGSVTLHGEGTVMFVPQRLYLPLGNLKAAICFPDAAEAHDDATIAALLTRVRLAAHVEHMHAVRMWQEELSPGEQQRVAMARILLHRPDLLVLDEATSALDADNARFFHEELLAALPDITLVSVVHDNRLRRYHSHALTIADGQAACSTIPEETE